MIRKDHLTTKEKNMHAKKIGTVSSARNIEKNAAMHCILYTLCEVGVEHTRYGLRNGFGILPEKPGRPPLPVSLPRFRMSGSYVIPGQSAMDCTRKTRQIRLKPLPDAAFSQKKPVSNLPETIPPFGNPRRYRLCGGFMGKNYSAFSRNCSTFRKPAPLLALRQIRGKKRYPHREKLFHLSETRTASGFARNCSAFCPFCFGRLP